MLLNRPGLSSYFELICSCCDKKQIDMQLLPKLTRRKNVDVFQMLYNRPKYVDTQILMQFFYVLNGSMGAFAINEAKTENQSNELKSSLLKNLERVFNHIEFGRKLDSHTLANTDLLNSNVSMSSTVGNTNTGNLTYIYKDTLNLLGDETLNSIVRFDFARFSISKLISNATSNSNISSQGLNQSNMSSNNELSIKKNSSDKQMINDEATIKAMQTSIYSLSMQPDPQLNHNFNLENQLCEGFLRAKNSKNILDMYMFIIGLGHFALSLNNLDEYLFVCVKHLLEIIDSNRTDVDEWTSLAQCLAQRQLLALSKKINMQEILNEFEEKVCEILADTIFNVVIKSTNAQSYITNANIAFKNTLKVFNNIDSNTFVRNYQRYLVPFIMNRATIENVNYKTITKSLDFLARKIKTNIVKLVEDNFPFIFTYTTIHSNKIDQVFRYITQEIALDIDKLVNFNKQRLFNELLSKCGNPRFKNQTWTAVCVLSLNGADEEVTLIVSKPIEDSRIVKAIEPVLLAVLVHFDMCLLKSTINLKEKCQVLESLNVLMALLGPQVITKVRHKLMTTLKLAMQQCSKLSELNCKLWDTFLRNVDKQALGPILNQISVNLLQLIDLQPYKIGKIFEYLIIQNKEYLHLYFNELYFIPDSPCLQQVNQTLKVYTDTKYIFEQQNSFTQANHNIGSDMNAVNLKALIYSINQYIR